MQDIVEQITSQDEEKQLVIGAIHRGVPGDPSKPSTGAYFLQNLPCPDLGPLPREDILDELRGNPVKTRKQRRDVGMIDGETVTHFEI